MKDSLAASYDYCQAVTKSEASNFYYGFMLLPRDQRRAIYAVYAFARECDDIVDAGLPLDEAADRLVAYRKALDRCLNGNCDGPVFAALEHAVKTYRIHHEYLYDLVNGIEMDLTVRRYRTFADLRHYCYLVASTVGLVSLDIFGASDLSRARGYAAQLGIALQLTNILRDLPEDSARGRIYLPQEELSRFSYSETELVVGRPTPAFRKLVEFQAQRVRDFYAEGRKLLPFLPRRARACVATMAGIYSRILDDIERDPDAVFRRRVSLGTGQKLALAGRELVRSLAR